MANRRPLGHGQATRTSPGEIVATFPLTDDMAGWHMAAADVDESGHFLTIRFELNPPALDTQETR